MTQIICLANSLKHSDRCIAGIDITSGKWVRPVSDLSDGRIPTSLTQINGISIAPLDVIDIPLSQEQVGYEIENRLILNGQWKRIGKVQPLDLLKFYDDKLIHDKQEWINSIPGTELISLPQDQRRTLQIIYTHNLRVYQDEKGRWRGSFHLTWSSDYSITDPELRKQLDSGKVFSSHCFVTISLSQPFHKESVMDELRCYRLIAGVIPLSEQEVMIIQTGKQMYRLGWTTEQGREYLKRNFSKLSRRELTLVELENFLGMLRSME